MKKIYFVFILIVIVISLTGCTDIKPHDSTLINLTDFEINSELPIYPECEFNYLYEYNDSKIGFHISSIRVILLEKNVIIPDSDLSGMFYPFAYTIIVAGYTDKALQGKTFLASFSDTHTGHSVLCTINDDGTFYGESKFYSYGKTYDTLYFKELGYLT